jgi:S-adenosyl-L-methionine hydrolase (adenosine-forming)
MGRRYDTVSFLSDFGTRDEHVGVVKAVLRDLAPHAVVIDLSHDVPAFDARAGGLVLARCTPYLPEGVVLAVVDPGAGTERRALAVEVGDGAGVFVGPDNGVLAAAVAMAGGAGRVVALDDAEYHLASPTTLWPGRDVYAPAAAHLCNGVDLSELGTAIDPDTLLPGTVPLPRDEHGVVIGEVLAVDRWGNCQVNVGPTEIEHLLVDRVLRVTIDGPVGDPRRPDRTVRVAKRVDAFAEIGVGAIGLVVDGSGMVSLCLDRRSAADDLVAGVGDQVTFSVLDDPPGGGGPISSPVVLRPGPR